VVKLSLVPKEQEYFRLFIEMAENLDKAAALLVKLYEDFRHTKSLAREILEHEHVGDKIVHDIVQRLNKTFITPLDREDIYALAATLDEILDSIEAAADAVNLYRLNEPTEYAREQTNVLAKATALLADGMHKLESRRGELRECLVEVNRLENDGDRISREAIAGLFDGDMKATDIIKWKDVYELLESAIDECEHVANIIESIVLKYN
jgi:predicted phosphate transport protein (TIGR00153 family)